MNAMESLDPQLLQDILSELKTFNQNYSDELERAENERTTQATEDSRHAEILAEEKQATLEDQRKKEEQIKEKEATALELDQERFEKIESFFESFSDEANQVIEGQKTHFQLIEERLDRITYAIEAVQVDEQSIVLNDRSNAYSIIFITVILAAIPIYFVGKVVNKMLSGII